MRVLPVVTLIAVSLVGCKGRDTASGVQEAPPGAVGLPVPQGSVIAKLENASAKTAYEAFTVEETVDGYGGSKSYEGDAYFFCTKSGGGGSLPPGAQGMVAQATYTCRAGVPFNPPPGAQGMPAEPFLKLDGGAARDFYNSFSVVATSLSAGEQQKSWQGQASFICSYGNTASDGRSYYCSVRDLGGETGGGGGGGGDDAEAATPVLNLTGASAQAVFKAMTSQEQATAGGGQKTVEGDVSIGCSRKGGSLPPGAQGMPAAATFACRVIKPFNPPPGAQGLPGPPVVKVAGKTARDFWNAFDVPAEADDDGGTAQKWYEGARNFTCSYRKQGTQKKDFTCTAQRGGGIPPGAQGLPIP